MHIDVKAQDHLVRVCLQGACTVTGARALDAALQKLATEDEAIVVELDQITELDSAGLEVLLELRDRYPKALFCFANKLVHRQIGNHMLHQQFPKPCCGDSNG